jgi:hypothetical protein
MGLTGKFEDFDRLPRSLYLGQEKSDLGGFARPIEAFNDNKGCPATPVRHSGDVLVVVLGLL